MKNKLVFILSLFIILVMFFTIKSFASDELASLPLRAINSKILGDVDKDGKLTINDIALLKLHIIGAQKLEEQNLIAADVDSDNLITINDLAIIKLMFLSDENEYILYLDEIANSLGSFKEAVDNNKITKYQFTYQISENLKKDFEDKINGDKLDYSKDRFYLIKNENVFGEIETVKFNLNNKMFIYNPYRKVILEIPENYTLIKKKATWYWRSSNELNKKIEDNEDYQNEFFSNLVTNYQISDMYLHLGPSFFRNSHSSTSFNLDKLKKFVNNAYNHNIRVYCLIGDVSYLLDENITKTIYNLLDDIENYNNSVSVEQRIAGVSYDNEFWIKKKDSNGNIILDLEWKTNEETRKKHVKYIKDATEYAQTKNLDVNFALPFNISRYTYTDDNGKVVNMYDEISKILEEPILMIYRDNIDQIYKYINDIQTDATESIISMSIRNGSSINIAIDTAKHTDADSQTFYEEEVQNFGINGVIYNSLNIIAEKIKSNNLIDAFSFSIHHAETLARFSGME